MMQALCSTMVLVGSLWLFLMVFGVWGLCFGQVCLLMPFLKWLSRDGVMWLNPCWVSIVGRSTISVHANLCFLMNLFRHFFVFRLLEPVLPRSNRKWWNFVFLWSKSLPSPRVNVWVEHLQIYLLPLFLSCFVLPEKLVLEDPVFRQDDRYFLTTEEAFDSAMKKSAHYVEVTRKLGIKSAPDLHYFKR